MSVSRRMAGIVIAVAAVAGSGVVQVSPVVAEPRQEVQITRFLGEQRLPYKMPFGDTLVGGLSGIDRDPRTDTWYFISDDRGRYNSPRFYTGRLDIDTDTGAFNGVSLTGVHTLLRADGTPYPAYGKSESVDPETIRYDQWSDRLLWGSEGDRTDATHPEIPLSDQSVRWVDKEGRHLGDLEVPANLKLTGADSGPRRNYGFEGLSFTPRGIAAIVEGPRYEDGESPNLEHGAPTRITVWGRDGKLRAQYAYQVDPLPVAPVPAGGDTDTGVSEILAIDDQRFLALERSWIEGSDYRVKLYEIDLSRATNILRSPSLLEARWYRPVTKRLVADLGGYQQPVQNLESLTWGPRLRNGECTLVIGSDDNFDTHEYTQFLAFAAKGC